MPLSQWIVPFWVLQVSGRPPAVFVQTHPPMQAQLGVPWHSLGIGAQYSPPPPATPPTSMTHTVPAGQPALGQVPWNAPPSGVPPSA
jgi:hypothetical protein